MKPPASLDAVLSDAEAYTQINADYREYFIINIIICVHLRLKKYVNCNFIYFCYKELFSIPKNPERVKTIKWRFRMRTNAPKSTIWIVAVVIGVLGLLGKFVAIPFLTAYAFWLVLIAFVILALATVLKGM